MKQNEMDDKKADRLRRYRVAERQTERENEEREENIN